MFFFFFLNANYEMTIWSPIWLILIASLFIRHYTLIIRHSFLCVYTCSLSVHRLCTQTSESMEKIWETNKNITWTFSHHPHSVSLLIICLPTSLLLPFCLFLLVCLLISLSLLLLSEDAGFLPRHCCVP